MSTNYGSLATAAAATEAEAMVCQHVSQFRFHVSILPVTRSAYLYLDYLLESTRAQE